MLGLTLLHISLCHVKFGKKSELFDLSQIRVLVLKKAQATCPQFVMASLVTTTHMQELSLCNFVLNDKQFEVSLNRLMSSVTSLQKLDVTYCLHLQLDLIESSRIRLRALALQFGQLMTLEASCFYNVTKLIETVCDLNENCVAN